jgi:hypothetical protein
LGGLGVWVFGERRFFFGKRKFEFGSEEFQQFLRGILNGRFGGFDGYCMGGVGRGIMGWIWGVGDSWLVSEVSHCEIRKICFIKLEGFFVKFKKNCLSQKYTRKSLAIPSKTIGRTEGPNLVSPGPTFKIFWPVISP